MPGEVPRCEGAVRQSTPPRGGRDRKEVRCRRRPERGRPRTALRGRTDRRRPVGRRPAGQRAHLVHRHIGLLREQLQPDLPASVRAVAAARRRWLPHGSRSGLPDLLRFRQSARMSAWPQNAARRSWAFRCISRLWRCGRDAPRRGSHPRCERIRCSQSWTDTEYFDVLGNDEEVPFGRKRPPQSVARAAPRAAGKARPHVIVGLRWKMAALLPRLLPRAAPARAGASALRPRHPDPSPKSIG